MFSEVVKLPVAGNYDVFAFSETASSCPGQPDPCTFRGGLFLDDEPLENTGGDMTLDTTVPFPTPTGAYAVGADSVPLPSGTHTLSLQVRQTSGPMTRVTEARHQLSVSGPFVSG